jgi:acyl-CoA synthetase (NDP forming)
VGDDRVFDAACKRLGMVRVQSIEDAIFTAETISRIGPVEGKLGFASMSGGFCEIAADRAEAEGVPLAKLSAGTVARLKGVLPGFGTPHNPLDTTGAVMLDPSIMSRALEALDDDPEVGAIAVSYDVPTHAGEDNPFRRALISEVQQAMARSRTPSILFSYTMRPVNAFAKSLLPTSGARYIGCGAHHGMVALKGAFAWSAHVLKPHRATAPAIDLRGARPASEDATLSYIASCGVPVIPRTIATTVGEVLDAAQVCGYPVVMKIASADIPHKTEVGGVVLGLRDAAQVSTAFTDMMEKVRTARPDARLDGVLVAPMRDGGIELFVGTLHDSQWGPALAVGLGGVHVEVLKDTALRLLPVSPADVLEMLAELRGSALLDGFRGSDVADRQRIAEVVSSIGNAALALGPDLLSLEVNPLRVDGSQCEALDALAVWDIQQPH